MRINLSRSWSSLVARAREGELKSKKGLILAESGRCATVSQVSRLRPNPGNDPLLSLFADAPAYATMIVRVDSP